MKERSTRQKQKIYEALCALYHPTATEVYDKIHAECPTVSRGTVFRVLGGFAENGRARRVHLQGSDDRFDATVAPHCHARCRVCGKIIDVFSPCLEGAIRGIDTGDFAAESFELEICGLCKECAVKTGKPVE